MDIKIALTAGEIEGCYPIISELRPDLSLSDFIKSVARMSENNNYKLAYLKDDGIKAVAGFRTSEWLLARKYLEIEELVSTISERSKGYGGTLFDWLCQYAITHDCSQIRLVSGVQREDAHRFYLHKGMKYEAKYFSLPL